MLRYLVARSFPEGLALSVDDGGPRPAWPWSMPMPLRE
jgi:hypothetical protein